MMGPTHRQILPPQPADESSGWIWISRDRAVLHQRNIDLVEPIKVRDNLQDLMLDPEGLNSINRNQQTDVKIFTLSLLLS